MKCHRQVRATKWRIRSSATTIAFSLLQFGLGLGVFSSGFSGVSFRMSEFSRGRMFGSEFTGVSFWELVFGSEFLGVSFRE